MYRKQMIVQNFGKIKSGDAPFYAWECITIQTGNSDVDLVIKVKEDMDALIEVLVESMNTINGTRNSADHLVQFLD